MQPILFNPGPVNLSKRVRQAMLRPDLCHREQEFAALSATIQRNLLKVYSLPENEWAAILITGSGTAAMEAMLTSCVPENGKVLIIENGVYGERLAKIAKVHDLSYTKLHHQWQQAIDLQQLEAILKEDKALKQVAVVHHETTTGRLNDIAALAEICKTYKRSLLIDAISSFGAEELQFENWPITACAATANKCLHAAPGVSFVICKRKELKKIGTPRTLYFDLAHYLKNQDADTTPFTQSIPAFYALSEALQELQDEGGWEQRRKNYRSRIYMVREGLSRLGIKPFIPKQDCSCVLHAFGLPKVLDYAQLHDSLKQKGFIIYAGQGALAKSLFRIACMGNIRKKHIQGLIQAIAQITRQ